MKNFFLFLLLFSTIQLVAQTNPITSINISLPTFPDANTANWGTGTSLITISAVSRSAGGRVDPSVEESKILVIIKKDGAKVCGAYTSSTAPAANFSTPSKVWSGVNAAALLGKDCTLPPGDYELSVQFFASSAAAPVPLSEERTKAFTIRANDLQNYQAPQAVSPSTGTVLSDDDVKKPIIFRWTPVIPKPQDPVTYRLRIWQLMQGQNAVQAMKTNQPIITKDIDNITQAIVSDYGDCAPPYLCDFVWTVQALSRDGKAIGDNNGTSQPFSYRKGGTIVPFDTDVAIILVSPGNGGSLSAGEPVRFSWQLSKKVSVRPAFYKLRIAEINRTQSPGEAIRTNKPIFEKDSLNDLSFQYPLSAPKFIENKTYAWSVQAFSREGRSIGDHIGAGSANWFIASLPLTAYLNGSKDSSVISDCTMQFSFDHPAGGSGGSYELKVIDLTLNPCIYPCPGTCNGVCSITPVIDYHTSQTSLTIAYDNVSGTSTDVTTGNAFMPSPNGLLIPGHKYMLICCEGPAGTTTSSNCVSFVYNGCGTGNAVCGCGKWDVLSVKQTTGGGAGIKTNIAIVNYADGAKIPWSCNVPFNFSNTYKCSPDSKDCVAATTWQVTQGGNIIQSGTGNNNLNGSFTPTVNGTYTLTVNASCNGKPCHGCTYTIVVDGCKETGCNCGDWGTFVVTKGNDYTKYDCGSNPSIPWKCNQAFVFSTTYKCSPDSKDCVAATTWQVTQDGNIIQSGTGNNNLNGSFTPTVNGTYTLTVNATCNGKPCHGCTYTIVVDGCKETGCSCGDWGTFVVSKGNDYTKYDCGSNPSIPWKCNQAFVFSTTYKCSPDSKDCVAATTWQVTQGGNIIQSGTGNNNLNGSFTPTVNGTYTLTVNASCNGKPCHGCTYTIVVDGCKETGCSCGDWGTFVVSKGNDYTKYDCGSNPSIPWKCNQAFVFSTTYKCSPDSKDCVAATTWQVTQGGNIIQSGTGNNNLNGSFIPTVNGTYTLTVNATCNGKPCHGCTYTIVVDGCKETGCSCNPDRYIAAATTAGGTLNIHCGDSKIYNYGTTITLTPQNICTPAGCTANWSMNIYDAQTGVFVTSGTGSGSSSFTFTLNSMAGYKIEFSSICGGNKCPCEFWIRTNPVAGCSCGDWAALGVQNSNTKYDCGSKILWKCNQPFIFNTSYKCNGAGDSCKAKTTWQVTKDGATVAAGLGSNNLAGNFTPVANGVYTITLTAECNGIVCKPCTYAVVVEGCTVLPCDPCKTLGVTVTGDAVTTTAASSDEVLLSGTLTGLNASTITKVTMEVVSLNIKETGEKECAKCTENKEWGNFINPATASFSGFSAPVLSGGNFGREWTWTNLTPIACSDSTEGTGTANCTGCAVPPAGGNKAPMELKAGMPVTPGGAATNGFSLPIALPSGSSLSCCSDEVTICIRYTWWDGCCRACDIIKCYVLQRKPLMLKQSLTPKK